MSGEKKGAAFCEMLKSNRSIRTLNIFIGVANGNLTRNIFCALVENEGITKVIVWIESASDDTIESASDETATDISYFLACSKTATTFHMTLCHTLETEFLESSQRECGKTGSL